MASSKAWNKRAQLIVRAINVPIRYVQPTVPIRKIGERSQ